MGLPLFQELPNYQLGGGIRTDFGTLLPPAPRVTYVRSTGVQTGDPEDIASRLLPTLAAALAECRAGMGDIVYVLPGHTENVTDALMLTNLVAGTKIVGLGDLNRDDAPTFIWTATGSQWAITVKNVLISGLRLLLDGANGVVKAIVTTAAGTSIIGNYIELASGAALKATIGIEVGSAAHDCVIAFNDFEGTATHNVTDGIKVVGGTVPLRLKILYNTFIASATAGNGLIHVTVAALGLLIKGNTIYNTHTASTATIAVDNVAADGIIQDNYSGILTDGVAASTGIVFAGTATIKCFQNFTSDEPRKSGALSPAAVAT